MSLANDIRDWQASDSFQHLLRAVSEWSGAARIDAAARAALTGLLSSRTADNTPGVAAQWAYDYAEAMEAERARRLK